MRVYRGDTTYPTLTSWWWVPTPGSPAHQPTSFKTSDIHPRWAKEMFGFFSVPASSYLVEVAEDFHMHKILTSAEWSGPFLFGRRTGWESQQMKKKTLSDISSAALSSHFQTFYLRSFVLVLGSKGSCFFPQFNNASWWFLYSFSCFMKPTTFQVVSLSSCLQQLFPLSSAATNMLIPFWGRNGKHMSLACQRLLCCRLILVALTDHNSQVIGFPKAQEKPSWSSVQHGARHCTKHNVQPLALWVVYLSLSPYCCLWMTSFVKHRHLAVKTLQVKEEESLLTYLQFWEEQGAI